MIKKIYHKLVSIIKKIKFYYSINWTKTLYFNFKKFPFSVAKKLPVYFYGSVKFSSIKGNIEINAPIKSGMIGFGQSYEIFTVSKKTAEIFLQGKIIFNGHVQFGKDYFVYIANNAVLQMGNMSSLGSNGKIICFEKITLGDYARIGFESQLSDTNAHQMINTLTDEKYPLTGIISIGNYNYISNRVTIFSNTKTSNYTTIASNSLCTDDYTDFGENILIGGIPAKILKKDISRDWNGEIESLKKYLII